MSDRPTGDARCRVTVELDAERRRCDRAVEHGGQHHAIIARNADGVPVASVSWVAGVDVLL